MKKKKIVAIATARSKKHLKKIIKPKKRKSVRRKSLTFNEMFEAGRTIHKKVLAGETPSQITPVPYKEDIAITISKERAERISHRLSDILCWSEGFKVGIRSIDEFGSGLSPFNNGIAAIRDIQDLLKMKL